MNDFRVEVFLSVARNLSFTKASEELLISQPAISKHISELENQYSVKLFERARGRVELTQHGRLFLEYAHQIHNIYRELHFEMSKISNSHSGRLIVGASTTLANYIMPSIVAQYMSSNPNIELSLISGNSEQIVQLVNSQRVDIGVIEGLPNRREFHYTRFASDELVLVASSKISPPESVTLEELRLLPILLRERGSGTLEVIERALDGQDIKLRDLNVVMQLGSTEAIKRFVISGNTYAILSIASLRDELMRQELSVVEIDELTISREFSFVASAGAHNSVVDDFIEFATKQYN